MNKRAFTAIGIVVAIINLSACDFLGMRSANNTGSTLSVSTTASFAAFRDGPAGEWQVLIENNDVFGPKTDSKTLRDPSKRFSLVFVCASQNADSPTQVQLFHGTLSDYAMINHTCRKSSAEIQRQVVYGKVSGLGVGADNVPEVAVFAGDRENQFLVYDSFAASLRMGTHEFIGYKGILLADGNVVPNKIMVKTVGISGDKPVSADMSFVTGFDRATAVPSTKNRATVYNVPATAWTAKINYRTENKTILKLVDFGGTTSEYYGIPLKVVNSDGTTSSTLFQKINEGHELIGETFDDKARLVFRARHLFKNPHDDVSLYLPTQPATGAAVQNVAPDKFTSPLQITIAASAPNYSDAKYTAARIHQWQFKGSAVAATGAGGGAQSTRNLVWDVYVTQSWMNLVSPTQVSVPPIIIQKMVTKVVNGAEQQVAVDRFQPYWNFDGTSPLTWEVHHFIASGVAATGRFDALLDYILNQEYSDSLNYAEAVQYSQ